MAVNREAFEKLTEKLSKRGITLVAVSKTKPASDVEQLYALGQRDFGENYVQELLDKHEGLPADIRWHFIGHLQSNKVKFIAPFVYLIHGVDSFKLLQEINRQGSKHGRVIRCLLQVHIATEETKFGLSAQELHEIMSSPDLGTLVHVEICGLMGMASFTNTPDQVRKEFASLKKLYDLYTDHPSPHVHFSVLSMGMSSDVDLAIEEGTTMVRIGSLLFGQRQP